MNNPFSADQIAALEDLVAVWGHDRFTLIGACALAAQIDMGWRETGDLDVTLVATLDEFPAGLNDKAGWRRHHETPSVWYSPTGVQVDTLLVGAEPMDSETLRFLGIDSEFNQAGLTLVQELAIDLPITSTLTVSAAPIPLLVLLKMVAYMDRPHARRKDLGDLGHIMDVYPLSNSDRRYEIAYDHDLSYELSGAYALGEEIGRIAGPDERAVVDAFLRVAQDLSQDTAAALISLAPDDWDADEVVSRWHSFEQGFMTKVSSV